jgi:hypothetical protein
MHVLWGLKAVERWMCISYLKKTVLFLLIVSYMHMLKNG